MESMFTISKWLHIFAGFLTLAIFWIPIVTKKGGKAHVRIGWIYVAAMAAVSISAFYMGIFRICFDPENDLEKIAFSWFLIFISILSSASAWYGIRALTFKKRKQAHRNLPDLLFSILLLTSGVGISIYGFTITFPLLQYFPFIGIGTGISQLIYWLTIPKRKGHAIIQHIGGMLACCISTVTAFVVFGAPRLLQLDSVNIILWFLPTIVMVPLIIGFTIHYTRLFNKPPSIKKEL